jgi:hypothetical protein
LTLRRRKKHENTFAPEIEHPGRLRWHSAKWGRNYREIQAGKNVARRFNLSSGGKLYLAGIRTNTATSLPISDKPLAAKIFSVYLMLKLKHGRYGTIFFTESFIRSTVVRPV